MKGLFRYLTDPPRWTNRYGRMICSHGIGQCSFPRYRNAHDCSSPGHDHRLRAQRSVPKPRVWLWTEIKKRPQV